MTASNGAPGRPRTFSWELARYLHDVGLSYSEIGRRLGVSRQAVLTACDDKARDARNTTRRLKGRVAE